MELVGRIYKMTNHSNNTYYIGSTILSLKDRLERHKSKAKICPNRLIYRYMNDWKNTTIIEIDKISKYDKIVLLSLEQMYIKNSINDSFNLNTNKGYAGLSKKEYHVEYYKEHREEKQKYQRDLYSKKNKEKIKCVCGGVYMKINEKKHLRTNKHIFFEQC